MLSRLSRDRVRQVINGVALVVLIAWPIYGAVGRVLRGSGTWPSDDFNIIHLMSQHIVAAQQYAAEVHFLYTPPAVIAMAATGLLPINISAAVWSTLSVLATLGSLTLGTSLVGLKSHPWRWTIALVGLAIVSHFVIRDLRSANCNMIYCFLLVAALAALDRGRDSLAGLLLAASILLKLYPVLVLGYLFWIGKRRAFGAGVAFLSLASIGLPLAVFGTSGLVGIYESWWNHLNGVAATLGAADHQMLISLRYTISRALNPAVAPGLVFAASAMWLGAVAVCLWTGRRRPSSQTGWDLAIDGGILALATVLISPYLEGYHPVVAILPVLALIARAIDWTHQRHALIAGSVLVAGVIVRSICGEIVVQGMHLDGIGIYLQMMLAAGGLVAIRLTPRRVSSVLMSEQPVAYQRAA